LFFRRPNSSAAWSFVNFRYGLRCGGSPLCLSAGLSDLGMSAHALVGLLTLCLSLLGCGGDSTLLSTGCLASILWSVRMASPDVFEHVLRRHYPPSRCSTGIGVVFQIGRIVLIDFLTTLFALATILKNGNSFSFDMFPLRDVILLGGLWILQGQSGLLESQVSPLNPLFAILLPWAYHCCFRPRSLP
jgi:hypothetical protein